MPLESLTLLDRVVLLALERMFQKVQEAYASLDTATAVEALDTFCREDLSKTYFSSSKQTLYFLADSDVRRRSCQTTLWLVLQGLLTTLAPVTSFLCEEVWDHVPHDLKWDHVDSVHLLRLPDFCSRGTLLADTSEVSCVEEFLEHLRRVVTSAVDGACKEGTLECMEQADVTVSVSGCDYVLHALFNLAGDSLTSVLQQSLSVSACRLTSGACRACNGSGVLLDEVCPLCNGDPLFGTSEAGEAVMTRACAPREFVQKVKRTTKGKCQRCWRYMVCPSACRQEELAKALSGDLCEACGQLVTLDTVARLWQQKCSSCGTHGHSDAECHLKKKRKNANKSLAGA